MGSVPPVWFLTGGALCSSASSPFHRFPTASRYKIRPVPLDKQYRTAIMGVRSRAPLPRVLPLILAAVRRCFIKWLAHRPSIPQSLPLRPPEPLSVPPPTSVFDLQLSTFNLFPHSCAPRAKRIPSLFNRLRTLTQKHRDGIKSEIPNLGM